MIKKIISYILSFAVAASMAASYLTASAANMTGSCTADVLNVRSGAGTGYSKTGTVSYGDSLTILSETTDSSGAKWYKISCGNVTGYVSAAYVQLTSSGSQSSSDADFESYMTKQGFPESYKPYLRTLHEQHPKWIFTAQKLGVDWNTALKEECVVGRNLVHSSALASWKSMEKGAYDFNGGYWYGLDGSWVAASKEIIMYYMDPRNFLNDTYIFMFENQSYDPSYQTESGVKTILADTFMSGSYTCPDTKKKYTYSQTFMDAAKKSGVSPYHLASRCRNEQGVNGAPQSLGTVKGYENYFNFFDIQAYATSTMTAAEMGCKYAKTTNPTYLLPWTNQYKSIVGGSIFLGTGYITKGQDTLYLQKFDMVDGGNGLYYHQYMTCVFGQANEAISLKNAYSQDILNSAMEFKIPVYNNMPDKLCPKPTSSGDNNNYLKSLSVSGTSISPKFDKFTTSYTAKVNAEVSSVTVNANPLGKSAKVSGNGKVSLKTGENTVKVTCTAASGVKRTYTIKITRKAASQTLQQGDVNGDKYLTVVDALLMLRYNAGKTQLDPAQLKRADMNGDGKVDVIDALTLLKKISQS
ncbi:SH3 domain-containing protein [Ruminococcus bicirculans]|uniref:SH3 domain-containing protein n=1 Tax=Ruminococcus bicirculans (ex Wegman et al. 2014) TaxID=1160721 RepID=A0AAW6DZT2_9FIRM|nr:SH3 domain-containing protein [Ruminococcus bicirculans (ex Wegman et al. 2014)]MDB8743678.1 SH3 domain-containing protein [Ruminococcus bicirculans (ex Wegman et al. 2014)]MDB8746271.1 SH3 domain-containing protein [Ruminococcus bicirculans (ex Wegman et al. 2014)]MDB8752261.1 SH3 domain-containing protein [Ruminococcus bicirculans (ex Wegman et al. 2014)]